MSDRLNEIWLDGNDFSGDLSALGGWLWQLCTAVYGQHMHLRLY